MNDKPLRPTQSKRSPAPGGTPRRPAEKRADRVKHDAPVPFRTPMRRRRPADLGEELQRAWRVDRDVPRALALANEILAALLLDAGGNINLDSDYDLVSLVVEVFWDGDLEGNRRHIGSARAVATRWRELVREAELTDAGLTCDDRLCRNIDGYRLSIRVEHRAGDTSAAYDLLELGLRALRNAAGGTDGLRREIEDDPFGLIGTLYGHLLAIAIPVVRKIRRPTRTQRLVPLIADALVIVRQIPIDGGGHTDLHALVVQTCFGTLKLARPEDAEIIETMAVLDSILRPKDARGQATRASLDEALAGYRGDQVAQRRLAKCAKDHLTAAGLARHRKIADQRGWDAA
jgi:hypothetical protein